MTCPVKIARDLSALRAARTTFPQLVPMATVEQVLGLYRDRYFDLSVQYFHEKLRTQHGIELSYTWVK